MNALMIRPENLPADPIELSKLNDIGKEYIDVCIQKIKSIDKLGDAFNERKKILKKGQDAARLLFEINKKIGELAKEIPQGQNKPEIIHDKNGKIIYTKSNKSGLDPKWKRMNLNSEHELAIANKVNKHYSVVEDLINESIENDEIPTIGKFRSKLGEKHQATRQKKHEKNYKEESIFQLNKMSARILNMSLDKDEYFLNKTEKVLEKMLDIIKDKKMMDDLKKNGPTKTEEKVIKRLK
jgi:hypothetical protein